jgi:glycosyltransferase involved in cell wall biosynthesis
MKIAYYIHHTTISAGGIFTYSIGVLRLLVNSPQIEKIIIITSNSVAESLTEFNDIKKIEIRTVDRKNFIVKLRMVVWFGFYLIVQLVQNLFVAKRFFDRLKNSISVINPYKKILRPEDFDLLHVPIQYSPIYKISVPIIITMHDLQEYHFPNYFSLRERLHRRINNKIAVQDSEHIIVSFEHVKNDIVKYFKTAPEKVSVCPPPFSDNWFLSKKEASWDQTQKKYSIKKKFILYPAATWEHKNHLALLEAVKKIRDEGFDFELVCTGNKTEFYSTIEKRLRELNLSGVVFFLGIVPEEDLISLYKNSSLVVIPTLYEAGSGPLYEAMRYRAPVVCSNVTSLPETIGNNDFIFNPNDKTEIVAKIKAGLNDEKFRERNIQNSINKMNEFQKIDYSNNFLNAYIKVIHNT